MWITNIVASANKKIRVVLACFFFFRMSNFNTRALHNNGIPKFLLISTVELYVFRYFCPILLTHRNLKGPAEEKHGALKLECLTSLPNENVSIDIKHDREFLYLCFDSCQAFHDSQHNEFI